MKWFTKIRKILAYRKACRPILKGNAKALRTKYKEVPPGLDGTLIAGRLEDIARGINFRAEGMPNKYMRCCGLAANQIGINARAFIVTKNGGGFRRYINPVILRKSVIVEPREELCFSHKGMITVLRAKHITIKADGMLTPKKLTGFEAWEFQHEFDHLEGIVHR